VDICIVVSKAFCQEHVNVCDALHLVLLLLLLAAHICS